MRNQNRNAVEPMEIDNITTEAEVNNFFLN